MTDEEIRATIKKIIEDQKATQNDFGKIMGLSMKALSGKADGNKVQAILKELLN